MSTSGNFAKPSPHRNVLQILSLFLEHSKESHIFQPKRELAGKNGFSIQLLFSCIPPCIGDGRRDHFAIRKWVPKQIAYWVLNERGGKKGLAYYGERRERGPYLHNAVHIGKWAAKKYVRSSIHSVQLRRSHSKASAFSLRNDAWPQTPTRHFIQMGKPSAASTSRRSRFVT